MMKRGLFLALLPVALAVDAINNLPDQLSSWDRYPNVLNITDEDRRKFVPVMRFPKVWAEDGAKKRKIDNYQVMDLQLVEDEGMASAESIQKRRNGQKTPPRTPTNHSRYRVGRYDENRLHIYDTEMFDDLSHNIDGYNGARTLHIGIDLFGPLGTKVFAFFDGVVHSAGYNPEPGDYGNVIVVEHDLGKGLKENETSRKVWALYGHLDSKSIKGRRPGQKIKRNQFLGRVGDIHENGGWINPHVHFQLSVYPPKTHDMPGVVAVKDRSRALTDYPDPRLVLGPLY